MSFDAFYFLGFFAVSFALFHLTRKKGWVLLAASTVFYLAAGWHDTLLFAAVLAVNYALAFAVGRSRVWLALAVAANVCYLAFFKYRGWILGDVGLPGDFLGEIVIPLGISFYTFKIIAYLVDVGRGKVQPEPSFPRFVLFIILFPEMVAGPIVRAQILLPQVARLFDEWPRRQLVTVWSLVMVLMGLAKKVVFADSLAPVVDDIFLHGPADGGTAWLGAWLFTFQIYFDFSGYSDIALGLAYLFGLRLPFNFQLPYLTVGPQDFWRRWHITLSNWIRDYLYIPMGGNRGGALRQTALLLAVMGLAGLWHGANWTYVAWGLGWALYIGSWRVAQPVLGAVPRAPRWALHMLLVALLWVVFRASSLPAALSYMGTMAGAGGDGSAAYVSTPVAALWAGAAIAAMFALHFAEGRLASKRTLLRLRRLDTPLGWGVCLGLIVWILTLPKPVGNPFIYFRF